MRNPTFRSRWQVWGRVLLIFCVWRGSLFLLEFWGLQLTDEFDFVGHPERLESLINPHKTWQAFPYHYFFDSFFRFDSEWYDSIVLRGYFLIKDRQSNVAFFPLYPYLSRWLGYAIGNPFIAGWIISNLSLLGGIFYIYRIGLLYFRQRLVDRALVLLLVFPCSFFFSTFYTEGLFLLTTAASFYYFFRQRYWESGLWGMLATLTRFNGILLFVCFLLDIAWEHRHGQQRLNPAIAFLGLIPLGLIVFMVLLQIKVGDPFAFIHIQSQWGKTTTFPLTMLINVLTQIDFRFPRNPFNGLLVLDWLSAVSFLGIGMMMAFKNYRLSLWSYVLLSLLMPLSSGTVVSMMRYCSVLFPAFFYLAQIAHRPLVYYYLIFVFTFFLALCNLRFMNWYWMT